MKKTKKSYNPLVLFKDLFSGSEDHVRISEVGKYILDDKVLASKIATLIVDKKSELENGGEFIVPNGTSDIIISLSTIEKDTYPYQKTDK